MPGTYSDRIRPASTSSRRASVTSRLLGTGRLRARPQPVALPVLLGVVEQVQAPQQVRGALVRERPGLRELGVQLADQRLDTADGGRVGGVDVPQGGGQ